MTLKEALDLVEHDPDNLGYRRVAMAVCDRELARLRHEEALELDAKAAANAVIRLEDMTEETKHALKNAEQAYRGARVELKLIMRKEGVGNE